MDVSVFSKHGQRSLRSALKAGLLGNGLLERTRSTSLALLGLTAAIGLSMVALALNQSWPLIAGAPIPGIGSGRQAVGEAAVVATGGSRSAPAVLPLAGNDVLSSAGLPGEQNRSADKAPGVAGSRVPGATPPALASPGPVSPVDASPPGGGVTEPAPVAQSPAPESASTPAATVEAVVVPVPVANPSSPAGPVSQAPESPVSPETPGAEGDEEDGHDHHSGRGTGRGRGHFHGQGGPDTGEPSEGSEAPPVQVEVPSSEAEGDAPVSPDSPDGGQSHLPSWGHGSGHGYGHDHGHW